MNLYREVDFLKEPCVFVGVHVVRWHEHPDQPTVGFVEVELGDIPEMRALQARVAELEKEHPVFVAAVAWATGREPFASATLEEAVDDYREETKL